MSRLSQTIDYINAEKITEDNKKHKYTDITIDDKLIKLRRKYRHAILTKQRIEEFREDLKQQKKEMREKTP